MDELGVPRATFYDWTSEKRSLMQKRVNQAIAIDLLNPYLTHQEIAEQNGYISEKKIDRFKAELRDKIPEIGKMSPEELQGADLCSKIINVRKIEHRKNCELLKIANVAKINNIKNVQVHENYKDYELQNVQMREMQRQKSCKCTKFYKILNTHKNRPNGRNW